MTSNTKARKCPLCISSKNELLHTQVFTGHFSHKIVCCKNCGFIYVRNTPSEDYYNKYYQEESKYEGVREHEAHETATKRELKSILEKRISKSAAILDVGCSTGSILAYAKDLGYKNLYGIDPAPKCQLVAKEKYHVNVGIFDIDNFHPKQKFDFIIISQVLEHLTNMESSISQIASWLNDDGYIFIGVPDAERFYLEFNEPFGEFSTEHINFITKSSLYYLMKNFTNVVMKSDKKILFSLWKKSNLGKQGIMKYIELSNIKLKTLQQTIQELPNKTIVWGVGALTRRLLSTTCLHDKALFFIDSNPNLIGKSIDGIAILSPDVLKEYNNSILIASYKFQKEIIKYLKKHKYSNQIFTLS